MKKAIFLTAENRSGKTSVSNSLAEILEAETISMRKIIRNMADRNFILIKERSDLINFSESFKKRCGSEVFVKKALDHFSESKKNFAVIESLRCPGEIIWLKENNPYKNIAIVPIGIVAPKEHRLERFLASKKEENLSLEINISEFEKHEFISNKGVELWEENISTVLKEISLIFENPNGGLDGCVHQILKIL